MERGRRLVTRAYVSFANDVTRDSNFKRETFYEGVGLYLIFVSRSSKVNTNPMEQSPS